MPEPTIDEAVAWTGAHLGECGFFFDFDGTLAPIQDDPQAVQPVDSARESLAGLARRARRVAVISARPMDFLADRLGRVPGLDLYGLYGLESSADGGRTVTTLPAAEPYAPVLAEVIRAARLAFPQALIEDKRLSCALHFRTAPESEPAILAWAQDRARQDGLRVQHGRKVVELKPPVDWDKGATVRSALPGLAGAWYFGDDLGDLPAFAALAHASTLPPTSLPTSPSSVPSSVPSAGGPDQSGSGAAGDTAGNMAADEAPRLRGFRVAVTSPESDQRLIDQTQYQVHGPAEVPPVLDRIIAAAP
jgi:trehalose 6-phosphate phosphatase